MGFLTFALALTVSLGNAQAPAPLQPCELPRLSEPARCGVLEVFEDRAAASGRKIPLRVVVLPATGSPRAADPLFILQGGPGQAASSLADFYAEAFAKVRAHRDIVLVDQRGTGGSNALDCDLFGDGSDPQKFLGSSWPVEAVRECRGKLAARADLALYTTPIAMEDLDAVRAWLGYETINLYGTSYGTMAGREYMRRHPSRVRAAVLRAAVAPERSWAVYHGRNAHQALERLFALCVAEARCRAAYPDPRKDLEATFARIGDGGATVTVDGRAVTLRKPAAVAAIRAGLTAPASAVQLPQMLRKAAGGDLVPLATTALAVRRGSARELAEGMFLTVACSELLAGVDKAALARESGRTFAGTDAIDELMAACAVWPPAAPSRPAGPLPKDVPVLVISGWHDPSTPPESGELVARAFGNSRHMVIRHAGHSFNNLKGCVDEVIASFLAAGSLAGLDLSCAERVAMPAFLDGRADP
jgi:pimeloyl-ACP methyl ester carboxylesterase